MPLKITIKPIDLWDEENQHFITIDKPITLSMEHSLVSVEKWEARWKKIYLSQLKKDEKTPEEKIDYLRCMTLTQNIDPSVYYAIDSESIDEINRYIEDPMTATTFSDNQNAKTTYTNKSTSSEEIYCMMFAYNVPESFRKWHLNRLLTLLKVCAIKNSPPKKMNKRDTMSHYAALNKARRAKYNSKG